MSIGIFSPMPWTRITACLAAAGAATAAAVSGPACAAPSASAVAPVGRSRRTHPATRPSQSRALPIAALLFSRSTDIRQKAQMTMPSAKSLPIARAPAPRAALFVIPAQAGIQTQNKQKLDRRGDGSL